MADDPLATATPTGEETIHLDTTGFDHATMAAALGHEVPAGDDATRGRLADALARFGPEIASNWVTALDSDTRTRFPELDRYIASLVSGLHQVFDGRGWGFTQTIIDGLAEQREEKGFGLEQMLQRGLLAGRHAIRPFCIDDEAGSVDELLLETLHECVFRFTESYQGMRLASESERMHLRIIKSLVMALEARDAYTKGHSISVALVAKEIADHMDNGLEPGRVHLAGVLHDIGKVAIPDSILLKEGPLSTYEWEILRTHTVTGAKILKPINLFPEVLDGTLYHHENHDGSGYPRGLEGGEIPPVARLLRVADSFDAMTSTRVYRASRSADEAIAQIKLEAGSTYDPETVEAFVAIMDSPEAIRDLSMASLTIDMRDFVF